MKKIEKVNRDLEDYFKIRFENKIAVRPRYEDCHLAGATRLLAKRHELEEVGDQVKEKQEWFKEKMAAIAVARQEVDARANGLKASLLKFDKFLRENDSKRHRGLEKIGEEHKLQQMKDDEIARAQAELDDENKVKETIQAAVDRNKHFSDFMKRCVEAEPDDYDEVAKVLKRYYALHGTKEHLTKYDAKLSANVQKEMLNMLQYSESQNTEMLGLNNALSELQTRYEQARQLVVKSENKWLRIKTTAAKQTLLLGQLKMAIHNLYQLCVRYHRARLLEQEELVIYKEPKDQLRAIQEVLCDIAAVHRHCVRASHKKQRAEQS